MQKVTSIEIMHISKKQRAIINSAVKPFYITSNYLGPGLQNLLKQYSRYFAQRRFSIRHFLPTYKTTVRNNYQLTVRFNGFFKKGGFAKKRRPTTTTFYGNTLLTKYGRKKQKKNLKRARKKAKREKRSAEQTAETCQQPAKSPKEIINVAESSSNDSAVEPNQESCQAQEQTEEHVPTKSTEPIEPIESIEQIEDTSQSAIPTEIDTIDNVLPNESNSDSNAEKTDLGDDTVDNIWNLDIQEVAALITESGNDEKQLSESKIVLFCRSQTNQFQSIDVELQCLSRTRFFDL